MTSNIIEEKELSIFKKQGNIKKILKNTHYDYEMWGTWISIECFMISNQW